MSSAVIWRDGHPFCERYGDFFYSQHDGRAECQHVFIDGNDLIERWRSSTHFTIGELGFGTGLNLLETWRLWRKFRQPNQTLSFISVEAHPLSTDIVKTAHKRWLELSPLTDLLLEHWPHLGNRTVDLDSQTQLTVVVDEALLAISEFPSQIDAWYLDGFSPSQNPQMWSLPLMQSVYSKTSNNGTFASYTAAGWVRRNLKEAGFTVEKGQGFGTKRDMISGVKKSDCPIP